MTIQRKEEELETEDRSLQLVYSALFILTSQYTVYSWRHLILPIRDSLFDVWSRMNHFDFLFRHLDACGVRSVKRENNLFFLSIRRSFSLLLPLLYSNLIADEGAYDWLWRDRGCVFVHSATRRCVCDCSCKIQLSFSQSRWNSLEICKVWRP